MPSFLPIEITPIEGDGFHLMISAEANGKAIRMLMDTGASRSVFDKGRMAIFFGDEMPELEENLQKSTGLGTSDMQSEAFYLDTLKIGDLVIRNYPAVVLDMSHVNHSYEELGLPPIDGVLGSDILMKYGARIDYRSRTLRINNRRVRPIND
ncbi:MAG TPA: retropepsin-like aspartic protease [Bacteroidales bacterium]|nr:retropepsin-like aspartic protease [Bacteroidales bacterium]